MIENIIFYLLDKKWSGVREGGHLVSCLRRKRDYVVAPEFIGGPTNLSTGIRGPLGCNFLLRECFCKMLLECFFATKTLTREKFFLFSIERN